MFGTKEPSADAEVINLAVKYLNELGLDNLDIEINSLGCPQCRKNYRAAIKEVLKPYLKDLCEDCNFRYEKNPLRILDCKVDSCKAIFEKEEIQKVILGDFICDECKEHFEKVKEYRVELPVLYSPALPFLEEIPQCHQYHFDGICLWSGCRYNGPGVCAVCIERVCRAGFFHARQFRSGAEDSACTWKGVRSDSSGCPGSEGVA